MAEFSVSTGLQRMLSILAQSEFAMTKATFIHEMNKSQMERYRQIQVSPIAYPVYASLPIIGIVTIV